LKTLLSFLSQYYTDDLLETYLIPMAESRHEVSLRLMDFLPKNYAPHFNLQIAQVHGMPINVYDDYMRMLARYKKTNFDAFRRCPDKPLFYSWQGQEHHTTLGQLHFLWWARQIGLFHYAVQHHKQLCEVMSQTYKKHNQAKQALRQANAGHPVKRQPLLKTSQTKSHSLVSHQASVIVNAAAELAGTQ